MYAQAANNYDETIVRVLGDADDEVIAAFLMEGDGTLRSLSPREPSAAVWRLALDYVAERTQTD